MRQDWSSYNENLIKRGQIILDPSFFADKQDTQPKAGRPYKYPKAFILFLLLLKFSLRLPYRQTEGLARTILSSLGIYSPNFRTLHYRFQKEQIDLHTLPDFKDLPEDFVLILDSTGIKVSNRGEWLRKKHGKRPRRGWIRLHVAIDANTGKVLSMEVTDEKVHDSQKAIEHVEKVREKAQEEGRRISKLIADTGYDTHEIFRYMHRHSIEPCVLVRSNARVTGNILRDKVVRKVRKGRRKWKRAVGYGRRWLVEGLFSAFKRWFGEYVSSVRFENIQKELILKVWIINLFLSVGIS